MSTTEETWLCEEDSIYSLERALAMAWTIDSVEKLVGGYTLGYKIYQACQSRYLTRYTANQMSLDNKTMGAITPGLKLLVEPALGPLSAALIPTMSYIYSEDALLDQKNYPNYFSLIETERMEGKSMIKFLEEMDYKFIDIWYHPYSEEMAKHIYYSYVRKVGCGRINKYDDKYSKTPKILEKLLNKTYKPLLTNDADNEPVREADVHLLLFNSFGNAKMFLKTVTDPNGRAWKNKIYVFGFTISRHKYATTYQDILKMNMANTDSDDLLIFTQSDMLNAVLPDINTHFYQNTSDNLLFDKFLNMRGQSDCDPGQDYKCKVKLSSWIPYIALGTKVLAHALNETLNNLKPGTLPCVQTLRSMVYKTIVSGSYSLMVEDLEFKDISFNHSTLSSGYVIEVYRRSFSLTKRQILGRVSFAESYLNYSLLQTMRPTQRQQYCSVDCKPGNERHWINVQALPCCWSCIACQGHSYSNITNSDSCYQCLKEEKSNDTHTACEPVEDEFIKTSSLYFIIGCLGFCVGIGLTLSTLLYVIKEEERPIIKASDPIFCYIFLLSLILGCVTALVSLTVPSVTSCSIEYISAALFVSLVTSSLALRCAKIYSLFAAAEDFSPPKFGALFTSKGQLISNGILLIVNICAAITTLHFGGWKYRQAQTSDHTVRYRLCFSDNQYITPVPFALPALLFLMTLILAFKMRKFPHNFRETANIFMATLVVFLACIMFLTGYKFSRFDIKALLRAIIMFMASIAFLLCMFVPKIVVLMKKGDLSDEKEQIKSEVKAFSLKNAMKKKKNTSIDTETEKSML